MTVLRNGLGACGNESTVGKGISAIVQGVSKRALQL
jgi:hypothetical protein